MIIAYHTNEHRGNTLLKPVFAEGNSQWLGEGYYFWQDYEFSEEWGYNRICKRNKKLAQFDIYQAELDIDLSADNVIDTVFNEEDYRKFVENAEKFAHQHYEMFGEKPSLEDFNDFISDSGIWTDIIAIRFQDLPTKGNRTYLKIKRFYYKKRIQIALYDVTKIHTFVLVKTLKCNKNG